MTLAKLLRDLGDIPTSRVRFSPLPGTATEADLLPDHAKCCERIDGTVVEKASCYPASFLTGLVIVRLASHVHARRLGHVSGPDTMFRLAPGNIRVPDVGVTPASELPAARRNVADWCPALCIEALSPSNTAGEMRRKRDELFASGCRLFWQFDPQTRGVDVYTTPAGPPVVVSPDGTLDGTVVIAGLLLPLPELYAELDALDRLGGGN